ncbi:DUF305 domain-containing protein [Blautia schinkii]|nr:DUF305 domain-containing protein [Blautia schinkii]
MNKKTTYWTIGIVAALILIVIVWLLAGSRASSDANKGNDANNQNSAVVTPAQGDDSQNGDSQGSGTQTGDSQVDDSQTGDSQTDNSQAGDSQTDNSQAGDSQTDDPHAGHGSSSNSNSQAPADDQLSAYLQEESTIMMDMMDGMENIDESGYAATDFLSGMIPHHEAAVAMAKSYLQNGAENQELIDLANSIIETQNKEIEDMNALVQEYRSADKKDEEKAKAHLKEYREMFDSHDDMMHGSSANSVDAAFAQGMLMHHEMAVEMAEDILEYTDEEAVITLANNIIATQKQEIEKMEDILDQLNAD